MVKSTETERKIFDRYLALQHKTQWTMDATAQDHSVYGIILNGFITRPAMNELREEFEYFLTEEGLVIR